MSTSAFFGDVQPQYRDAGCPSQCMGMNEYTTVADMYSFSTSPDTPLLASDPLSQSSLNASSSTNGQVSGSANLGQPSTFIAPTRFAGPGVKMSGAQMARIVSGYEMMNGNKNLGGRSAM